MKLFGREIYFLVLDKGYKPSKIKFPNGSVNIYCWRFVLLIGK
jgi:hypothetical protein